MQTQTKASIYTFSAVPSILVPFMLQLYSTVTIYNMAWFPLEAHGKSYACGLKRDYTISPWFWIAGCHGYFVNMLICIGPTGLRAQRRSTSSHEIPPQVVALLAGVHVVHRLTAATANIAAPDELTLAALYVSYHVCVVAPPTAQQVTAVRPGWSSVTPAAPGPRHAQPPVLQAVIGRFVEED